MCALLNTITYGKYLKRNLGYYKIYFLSWFMARFSQNQFKKYRQLSLKIFMILYTVTLRMTTHAMDDLKGITSSHVVWLCLLPM